MPNPPPSCGSAKFPTFARLFHRFCNWRTFGRALVGFGGLATLIGLFYGEENWRGRRAWNQYRHELEACGVPLDLQALRPKPVPDDQNFAATSSVRAWFKNRYGADIEQRWKDNFSLASKRVPETRYHTLAARWPGRRQFVDLVAWEGAFAAIRTGETNQEFRSQKLNLESGVKAALAVLEALKDTEPKLAELRAASRRPFARYPIEYEVESRDFIAGVALANVWQACVRLKLKSCAELAAGQSDMALEDLKLMLYLVDSFKEPFLVAQWSRIHVFEKALQPVWEGLAEHAWSQPQLQELTTRLQHQDFLADSKLGLDGERAAKLWRIDSIWKSERPVYLLGSLDERPIGEHLFGEAIAQLICRTMPSGWFAQEKLGYCQLFQMYLRSGFEPSRRRVSPAELQANAAEADRQCAQNVSRGYLRAVLGHRFAAAALIQTNDFGTIRGFAVAQANTDQAALACALEQYRLAHGQFPDKLEALMPQFISQLPKDALTGEPYKYRRADDGQFVLYSVGWNEKDDGGTVALSKDGSVDARNGDWVWGYPTR
jgi:hypothetical protein